MKMPFIKTSIVTLLLAVSALAISQPAAAGQTIYISGNSCFGIGDNSLIRTQWGPYEAPVNFGGPVDVQCPIATDGVPWTSSITFIVNGYNRNSSDPLTCSLMITDDFGNLWSTLTVPLTTAQQPFQTQSTYRLGAIAATHPDLSITCHMPIPTTAGFSHLTSVVVIKG